MMVQPFYCPYCGEQDIRPAEGTGAFACAICDRNWKLEYQAPQESRA